MSNADIRNFKLVELYHRYVGEPESRRDVYGYWLFLVGSLAGLVGVGVYQVEQAFFPGNLEVRQAAIVLAAVGLAVAMLGIVVLLPVRRRGMQASVVGLLVALGGIALFVQVYPQAWYFTPDYSAQVIAVYTAGVAIIVGVAVLVPVVTGEKGLLVEPELGLGDDEPPIMVGDASRDAFFTVYETPTNDWTWRAIQRDAVARSADVADTDTDARMAVESVQEKIGSAGLLEITTAAFRLYRTEDDGWRWSLVEDDGSIVARNETDYADRDAVESAVSFLKEAAPDADVVEIRGAAFDVYEDEGGRWHWRLLDDQRRPLAASVDSHADAMAAESDTREFVETLEESRVLALDSIGIELFEAETDAAMAADGGSAVESDAGGGRTWRWRVIDGDDRHLVTGASTYEARRDAETAADTVAGRLADAAVLEYGTAGYEVYRVGEDWHWRLRDEVDDVLATGADAAGDEAAAREAAERARGVVQEADIVEFEGADYEVYPDGGEWHWRLVSADREVLADSTEAHDDREAAEAAADRVREQALAADLVEFEQAAFQQYESGGEWRWRLIDEDGQVLADSGESYEDKSEVTEGMRTLKEHAPDAEVLEIDTAAFEIYRTDGGDYTWRLIDEAGKLIAESAATHPSRAAARDSVDFLLDHVDEAAVRPMERAAFQLFGDDDAWGFWLVHTDGTVLAEGADRHPTYDDATSAIAGVREASEDAPVTTVGDLAVQLRQDSGWHWRVVDRDHRPVAEGERTYEYREAAMADVERLTEHAADAPVFDLGSGVVWVDRTGDGWRWRLVDEDRDALAASPETYASEAAALEAVETVEARAPSADTIDIDTLAYELYRDGERDADASDEQAGWRWRLIDEDERVLAVSATAHEDREAAEAAIEAARSTTGRASIIEIDEVAFEFHERDDGWIWRLIDDNGSPLAESVDAHGSRQDAREEMLAVKEHAPDGETVVSW